MTEAPKELLTLPQIIEQSPPLETAIDIKDPRGPIQAQVSIIDGQIRYVVPGSAKWTHPELAKKGAKAEVE